MTLIEHPRARWARARYGERPRVSPGGLDRRGFRRLFFGPNADRKAARDMRANP